MQHARHNHGQHQVSLPAGAGIDEHVQTHLAGRAQHRRHMAVWPTLPDVKRLVWQQRVAGQATPNGVDDVNRQGRQVGDGALLDLVAFAIGLTEQVRHILAALLTADDFNHVHRARWPSCHAPILPHQGLLVKHATAYNFDPFPAKRACL